MPADGEQIKTSTLTDQQQRALGARGTSVALSAGAGCGKTFVLTERFIAELIPSKPADRPRLSPLVAITFTERAAREMRDRIRSACRRRLLQCDPAQSAYWLELVRDLDAARISTIHAFSASLLRAHAVDAGIDPRFRVLDGAQASTLLFTLTDDVLRDRLAERDEAALALVVRFGLDRLRKMMAALLAMRQEIDWKAWRDESPERLAARWEAFFREDARPRILRQVGQSAAARTVLDIARRFPPEAPKMRHRCEMLLDLLPNLPSSDRPLEDLTALREAAMVQGGATKNTWGDEAAFERFRDAAKALRESIDAVKTQLAFSADAALPAAQTALQVLHLAADLDAVYDRRKRELGVLDFNDLLIGAKKLLAGPEHEELRRRLAGQIRLLLVDEFQDTDPLQVELVKALCDNQHLRGKLFLVGDYKQSIYRFRGADPRVFRRLREEIPEAGRLPLSLNFRSQPAILDFVNTLFSEALGPEYEPLRPHRPQIGPTPGVEFLWACDSEEEPVEDAADSAREEVIPLRERLRRREADWIARRIRAMLDDGERLVWDEDAAKKDKPTVRAVRPGDVALLFRALSNVEYYEEALRRYGIPYYLVGGQAFYSQQEIYDLLNLLRAVNSPCDEVSLAGALRSPMFGLLDETLLWLAKDSGLAAGLFDRAPAAEIEPDQRRQVEYAATTLRALRAMKDRLPVARLIQEALDRTGYDAMLLAEFLGERKLANLHKLIDQARSFDRAGIFTLSDFITQLSEFVARQPDEALAATHPESSDVVKLMSIHQSKGLEFPVVVVPDVCRKRLSAGPLVAFTPELGPMFKDPDATTGYELFRMADNEEDLAEHDRLLYVATTRAADYLILSAGLEKLDAVAGSWLELIGNRFDLSTGAAISVDLNSNNAPQLVKVTTERPSVRSKQVDSRRRRDLLKIIEKARQMAQKGEGRRPQYIDPIQPDPAARRQFSFSRLTGKLHARLLDADSGMLDVETSAEPTIDARDRGILVHSVLAEIDFARPGDIAEALRRHAEEQPLEIDDCKAELSEMIERFVRSPRAAELVAAPEIYRELEFLLAWPPGQPQMNPEDQALYFQGFIDCLYRDPAGGWHLIDYKTNHATSDNLKVVAAEYEMQMLVYGIAVENILGQSPAELTLCFLRPGLEYRWQWNEAARRRAIEMVNHAIQSNCGSENQPL